MDRTGSDGGALLRGPRVAPMLGCRPGRSPCTPQDISCALTFDLGIALGPTPEQERLLAL